MTTLGSTSYTQIAYSRGWSHDNGRTVTITYKGPRAGLRTFYDGLEASPGAIDAVELDTTDDGTAVVRVTYQDTDETGGGGMIDSPDNDLWELVAQDIYKDIRQFNGTSLGTKDFTKDADQAALSGVYEAWRNGSLFDYATVGGTVDEAMKNLLLRNADQFVRTAVVLRKTLRFSRRSSLIAASWAGVDRAWMYAGELGSPSPTGVGTSRLLGAVSSMPEYDATKRQWLKRAPQLSFEGRKYSLSQEWWFARRWSYNYYLGDLEGDGSNP